MGGNRTLLDDSDRLWSTMAGETGDKKIMGQLFLAIVGFLACSACQGQPTLPKESKATRAEPQQAREASLPNWLAALIKQQPANSIEESVYQGKRAYLGSGLVDQSQKMTVAARAMAERKTVGHRS